VARIGATLDCGAAQRRGFAGVRRTIFVSESGHSAANERSFVLKLRDAQLDGRIADVGLHCGQKKMGRPRDSATQYDYVSAKLDEQRADDNAKVVAEFDEGLFCGGIG
jgi:hypothetical protein